VQGVANAAYLEGFPFSTLLSVAPYCVPGGIRVVSGEVRSLWITRRRFVCKPDCQMLGVPPNRLGEAPTRDFHLRVDLPVPFTRADIHAELTHVALTSMHRSGAKGSSVDPTRRSLQNTVYRLPRIPLLRGWVNTSLKRKRGPREPLPSLC
jgi:hypothetical protein